MSVYHSEKFYRDKYRSLKAYSIRESTDFPFSNNEAIGIAQVRKAWEKEYDLGTKDIYKSIKYLMKYPTRFKTAKAFYDALKEEGIEARFTDIKSMSTQELFDQYGDVVMERSYERAKANGDLRSKALFFAEEYYGSP